MIFKNSRGLDVFNDFSNLMLFFFSYYYFFLNFVQSYFCSICLPFSAYFYSKEFYIYCIFSCAVMPIYCCFTIVYVDDYLS